MCYIFKISSYINTVEQRHSTLRMLGTGIVHLFFYGLMMWYSDHYVFGTYYVFICHCLYINLDGQHCYVLILCIWHTRKSLHLSNLGIMNLKSAPTKAPNL